MEIEELPAPEAAAGDARQERETPTTWLSSPKVAGAPSAGPSSLTAPWDLSSSTGQRRRLVSERRRTGEGNDFSLSPGIGGSLEVSGLWTQVEAAVREGCYM